MGYSPPNPGRLHSRWLRVIGASVVFAVLLYLGAVLIANPQATWASISSMPWQTWLLVLLLSLVNYALRFLRWQNYLYRLGHQVPWQRSGLIYLGGFALTTSPGKAGEALRSVYLAADGVPYSRSLAAFFTERLMDTFAMLALACLVLTQFAQHQDLLMMMLLLVVGGLLILRGPHFANFLKHKAETQQSERWKALVNRFGDLFQASQALLAWLPLGSGLVLGLLSWGAEGFGLYLILQALGADIQLYMAVGIYAFGILIGALSFIPGGLGSTEATMATLLVLIGINPAVSVAATLICRVATLWFAVGLGAGSLAVLAAGQSQDR